ncbi:DUF5412 family protein [Actinomycetes bacterium NPDC127524]
MLREKIRYGVIFVCTIAITITWYFINSYYNKDLSKYDVSQLEKVDMLVSPSKDKKLSIYLGGGIFGRTDYTYIGQIENLKNHSKSLIFILPGEKFKLSWLDNEHLQINGDSVSIKSTYDFREK